MASEPNLQHLLDLLADRGLKVRDRIRSETYLRNIGYTRLRPYIGRFALKGSDRFPDGTSFDDIMSVYQFDKRLRLHFLDAAESVEIGLRANLNHYMSPIFGPRWHLSKDHVYSRRLSYETWRDIIKYSKEKSDVRFEGNTKRPNLNIKTSNDKKTYTSEKFFANVSFGLISRIYASLLPKHKDAVSTNFQTDARTLEGWLIALNTVRNISAHHGRLWDKRLKFNIREPFPSIRYREPIPMFDIIHMTTVLIRRITPYSVWGEEARQLIVENKNIPIQVMGFPQNWKDLEFWHQGK